MSPEDEELLTKMSNVKVDVLTPETSEKVRLCSFYFLFGVKKNFIEGLNFIKNIAPWICSASGAGVK